MGRSTYYRHRARFYDSRIRVWISTSKDKASTSQSSDSDDPMSVREVGEIQVGNQITAISPVRQRIPHTTIIVMDYCLMNIAIQ